MPPLEISVVDPKDIETHVQLRTDFIRDMLPGAPGIDWTGFFNSTRQWVETHIREKKYLTYAGCLDGKIATFAGILLYTLPPLPGRPNRKVGHVLNFLTYPAFRKQGLGTQLIEHIKVDAPTRGITRLFLNAAPMGERIYRRAGFIEQSEKALILELG